MWARRRSPGAGSGLRLLVGRVDYPRLAADWAHGSPDPENGIPGQRGLHQCSIASAAQQVAAGEVLRAGGLPAERDRAAIAIGVQHDGCVFGALFAFGLRLFGRGRLQLLELVGRLSANEVGIGALALACRLAGFRIAALGTTPLRWLELVHAAPVEPAIAGAAGFIARAGPRLADPAHGWACSGCRGAWGAREACEIGWKQAAAHG